MTPVWLVAIFSIFVVLQSPRPGKPDAKELGAQAIRLGIPMPPKDAVLVLAYVQGYVMGFPVEDDDEPPNYSPAFLIEEKADGSVVVLRGFERETVRPLLKNVPAYRKFSLDPVDPKTTKYSVDFGLDAYVGAAQLAARGDLTTAQGILKRFDEGGRWFGHEDLPNVYRDPRFLLCQYWVESQLIDLIPQGPAHWQAAHDGLKAVLEEIPLFVSPTLRDLVDDLALTLRTKPPVAGSTEALVLEWAAQPIMRYLFGVFNGDKAANRPARAVVARGFDVIPDLIALLDDRRVSAHQSPGFNHIPSSNLRIGDLADELLRETTRADLRPADDETAAEAWRMWWAKARVRPERDYFLGAVFEMKDGNIVGVRAGPAHVLGQKFPDSLQKLCVEFTERATPEAHLSELVAAVSASTLPKAERIKTLVAFAQRGTLSHRRSVLWGLADLDAPECARILLPLIEKLPKDTEGRYFATAEAGLGYVVAKLDDDAIWRAYLAAARRASVGLRVEMLGSVCDSRPEAKNRGRRMAFLSAFLDDEAVRDAKTDPKKFDGASGAHILPRVAVRDYAAWSLAGMLKLKDRPDEAWDAAKWEELRRKVRVELAREKLPDLAPKR